MGASRGVERARGLCRRPAERKRTCLRFSKGRVQRVPSQRSQSAFIYVHSRRQQLKSRISQLASEISSEISSEGSNKQPQPPAPLPAGWAESRTQAPTYYTPAPKFGAPVLWLSSLTQHVPPPTHSPVAAPGACCFLPCFLAQRPLGVPVLFLLAASTGGRRL